MQFKISIAILSLCLLSGCVGTAIDVASDAAVSVIKVPFKVVGAVVEGVSGSDKKEDEKGS